MGRHFIFISLSSCISYDPHSSFILSLLCEVTLLQYYYHNKCLYETNGKVIVTLGLQIERISVQENRHYLLTLDNLEEPVITVKLLLFFVRPRNLIIMVENSGHQGFYLEIDIFWVEK